MEGPCAGISYGLGFAGTVSEVNASATDAIEEPLRFSYSYNRKDYPDWSNHQFTVPGLPFFMPPLRDDAKYPVWLGSPMETESDAKVELPSGYTPEPPSNVDLNYDFAEYHAAYSLVGGAPVAKRRLLVKQREVPASEFEDYRKLVKGVQNDVNQYVQTSSAGAPATPNGPSFLNWAPFVAKLRDLPGSASPDASRMEAEAQEKMIASRDPQAAIRSLYRAVEADPKFIRAWVFLGMLLLQQRQKEPGMDAFHKAMALGPEQVAIPKALGFSLMASRMLEDAILVWQEFMKAHPDDVDGPANLGNCMYQLKRYSEAVPAYEAARNLKPDRPESYFALAMAYLHAGERDKAAAAFAKLEEVDPKGTFFNNAAYQMANADLQLPLAKKYAEKAVQLIEEGTQKITLPELKLEDVRRILTLAAFWDTLGWVNERMSNMEVAEQYLLAAWKTTQDGVVAGHLCHLYRRLHRTREAVQMCSMGIFQMSTSRQAKTEEYQTEIAAAQENLKHLTGTAAPSKSAWDASALVTGERTFKLPRFLPGTQSAEFFVLLASDGQSGKFKVEDAKFISGPEKMKNQGKQLKNIDFNVPAPSHTATRFVRRGILGCYQYTGCLFVLLDPVTVNSLN